MRASCVIIDGRCSERGNRSVTIRCTQFACAEYVVVKARSGFVCVCQRPEQKEFGWRLSYKSVISRLDAQSLSIVPSVVSFR